MSFAGFLSGLLALVWMISWFLAIWTEPFRWQLGGTGLFALILALIFDDIAKDESKEGEVERKKLEELAKKYKLKIYDPEKDKKNEKNEFI